MMLDKSEFKRFFFKFEFKIGHKQWRQLTCSVNANKHMVEWWFKKFCKGGESLENEEQSG